MELELLEVEIPLDMLERLERRARVLGMTAEELASLWLVDRIQNWTCTWGE